MTEPTYHILLPFTQEGPFTCAELRARLLSGKARSDDRLVDESGRALMFKELIPDAEDISRQRSATSDRIRRTSRERQQAVDAALESSPPEPVDRPRSAPLPTVAAVSPPVAPAPPRPAPPSRRGSWRVLVPLLVTGVAVNLWLWLPHAQAPLPPLFQPPAITPLTRAELTALPKERLLARIGEECTRRMYADRRGLRAGPQVLPAKAWPLWVAGVLEPQVLYNGLPNCLGLEHAPGTSRLPSLAQLVDAYAALGLDEAAQALREALAIDAAAAPARGLAPTALADVQARLAKALGGGSDTLRSDYAIRHRQELFPDLP